MKLVDILVRELAEWPKESAKAMQDFDKEIRFFDSVGDQMASFDFYAEELACDACDEKTFAGGGTEVTLAEWQAAVDALNAPKVVEWDGVGSPQPGCSIEYSIGDGWYPCEVRYVLNRDDCPGIALIAWCEHLGKDQYLSNDRDHRFRPARTAEQVAAEEREKGIQEICATLGWLNIRSDGSAQEAAILYDAGYRKEPKPCGS